MKFDVSETIIKFATLMDYRIKIFVIKQDYEFHYSKSIKYNKGTL